MNVGGRWRVRSMYCLKRLGLDLPAVGLRKDWMSLRAKDDNCLPGLGATAGVAAADVAGAVESPE